MSALFSIIFSRGRGEKKYPCRNLSSDWNPVSSSVIRKASCRRRETFSPAATGVRVGMPHSLKASITSHSFRPQDTEKPDKSVRSISAGLTVHIWRLRKKVDIFPPLGSSTFVIVLEGRRFNTLPPEKVMKSVNRLRPFCCNNSLYLSFR